MDDSEFHDLVTRSDAVDDPESITEAALETLGETLSGGQAADVAEWLPDRYAETIREAGDEGAESLSYDAFLERVRERDAESGADGGDRGNDAIQARAGAVADAVAEAVPHDEQLELRSQLPDELGSLFTEGQGVR